MASLFNGSVFSYDAVLLEHGGLKDLLGDPTVAE